MQKEILCFGDSNTYGLIPGTQERYQRTIRWTGILEAELSGRGYHVIEEGLCGRTTIFEDQYRANRKGSDLLPAILECHKPLGQVILMLGTNDCKTFYHASAEEIGAGIDFLAASEYAKPSAVDQQHLDEIGHRNLAKAFIKKIEFIEKIY